MFKWVGSVLNQFRLMLLVDAVLRILIKITPANATATTIDEVVENLARHPKKYGCSSMEGLIEAVLTSRLPYGGFVWEFVLASRNAEAIVGFADLHPEIVRESVDSYGDTFLHKVCALHDDESEFCECVATNVITNLVSKFKLDPSPMNRSGQTPIQLANFRQEYVPDLLRALRMETEAAYA